MILTPRQLEVAKLVASGLANKEICAKLFVSEKTVKFHTTNIYKKLGIQSRTQLTIYAIRNGWSK